MQFIVVLATLAAVATAAPGKTLFERGNCDTNGEYYCAGSPDSDASWIYECDNGNLVQVADCGNGNCCAYDNGQPHCTC